MGWFHSQVQCRNHCIFFLMKSSNQGCWGLRLKDLTLRLGLYFRLRLESRLVGMVGVRNCVIHYEYKSPYKDRSKMVCVSPLCLLKRAWPFYSLPRTVPSTVSMRGLKACLVHCSTSETVCVFVCSAESEMQQKARRATFGDCDECWKGQTHTYRHAHTHRQFLSGLRMLPNASQRKTSIIKYTWFGKVCICVLLWMCMDSGKVWLESVEQFPQCYCGK